MNELLQAARTLYQRYSNPRAYNRNLQKSQAGSLSVPVGSPWSPPAAEASDPTAEAPKPGKRGKKKADAPEPAFHGDMSLAQSIQFMYDSIVSREVSYAVAEGDVGRVYEGIKVRHTFKHVALRTDSVDVPAHALHVRRIEPFEICDISSRNDHMARIRGVPRQQAVLF